jgi:hypothetical protein
MNRRKRELLEDQECMWDIDSLCGSPRRLVRENTPGSCRYQRPSRDATDEPRPTRRGAYNDHPLTKAILRHPGTSVHEGGSLASTVTALLADQDLPGDPWKNDLALTQAILRHPGTSVHEGASLVTTITALLADQGLPGGPGINDRVRAIERCAPPSVTVTNDVVLNNLVTATERCVTPSVAVTSDVILDPDPLYLRSGSYPPGSLTTNRAADPVTRCVRPRTSTLPGAVEGDLDLEMEPQMDEESDPDVPDLTQETTGPVSPSDEGEMGQNIFFALCRGRTTLSCVNEECAPQILAGENFREGRAQARTPGIGF